MMHGQKKHQVTPVPVNLRRCRLVISEKHIIPNLEMYLISVYFERESLLLPLKVRWHCVYALQLL